MVGGHLPHLWWDYRKDKLWLCIFFFSQKCLGSSSGREFDMITTVEQHSLHGWCIIPSGFPLSLMPWTWFKLTKHYHLPGFIIWLREEDLVWSWGRNVYIWSTSIRLQIPAGTLPLGKSCCCYALNTALNKVEFKILYSSLGVFLWWSRWDFLWRFILLLCQQNAEGKTLLKTHWRCGPGWGHSQCSAPLHLQLVPCGQPWRTLERACARAVPSS